MVEVLVAIAITSILCTTYIGVSRQSARFAGDIQAAVKNINIAQEYFIQNSFTQRRAPVPEWVAWQGDERGDWRLSSATENSLTKMVLETKVDDISVQWSWLLP